MACIASRPTARLHLLADDFALPNGLAFSPDESVLYIDDSAHKHIRAFDVRPDGTLTNSRILLDMASDDPGVPDGLKVDRARQRVLHRTGRCVGVPPRRRAAGAHRPAGAARRTWRGARTAACSS